MRGIEGTRMKKSVILTSLAIALIWTIPMNARGMAVDFPDDELEKAIRIALSIPAESRVTTEDLVHLTDLDAGLEARGSSTPIRSLEGLQYAYQLSSLSLEGMLTDSNANQRSLPAIILDDTTILNNLQELTSLNISKNCLQFFDFSQGFQSLRNLDFSYNSINDISILSHLQNLEDLSIEGNPITGSVSLKYFPNLKRFIAYRVGCTLEQLPSSIQEIGLDAQVSHETSELELKDMALSHLRITIRKQLNQRPIPTRLSRNQPTIHALPGLTMSRDVNKSTMIVIQCNGAQTPSSYNLNLSTDLHSWSPIGYIIFTKPTDSFHVLIDESDHSKVFFMKLVQSH